MLAIAALSNVAPVPVASAAKSSGAKASADRAEATMEVDLDTLIDGLVKTHAIGLFSKLSLKGKADTLLRQIGEFHDGKSSESLAHLEERYHLLLHQVMTMVQDKDKALADMIASARDDVWTMLADHERYAAVMAKT